MVTHRDLLHSIMDRTAAAEGRNILQAEEERRTLSVFEHESTIDVTTHLMDSVAHML